MYCFLNLHRFLFSVCFYFFVMHLSICLLYFLMNSALFLLHKSNATLLYKYTYNKCMKIEPLDSFRSRVRIPPLYAITIRVSVLANLWKTWDISHLRHKNCLANKDLINALRIKQASDTHSVATFQYSFNFLLQSVTKVNHVSVLCLLLKRGHFSLAKAEYTSIIHHCIILVIHHWSGVHLYNTPLNTSLTLSIYTGIIHHWIFH